jgi:hypothetical protein
MMTNLSTYRNFLASALLLYSWPLLVAGCASHGAGEAREDR